MSLTIREQIFQNLKTALQGIQKGAGYNYTVEEDAVMIIHGKRDDVAYGEPLIYIYPATERVNIEAREKGFDYNELSIDIEAWIRGDKEDMNANINKMLADLIMAVTADPQRGGIAIDTMFLGNDVFLTDLSSDKVAIILSIQVDYETKFGSPYEQ